MVNSAVHSRRLLLRSRVAHYTSLPQDAAPSATLCECGVRKGAMNYPFRFAKRMRLPPSGGSSLRRRIAPAPRGAGAYQVDTAEVSEPVSASRILGVVGGQIAIHRPGATDLRRQPVSPVE